MKPWKRDSQLARVWLALHDAAAPQTHAQLQALLPDLSAQQLTLALAQVKKKGFIRITANGMWEAPRGDDAPRPVIEGDERAATEGAALPDVGGLAARAGALLRKATLGLNSAELAAKLGCDVQAVELALGPAVEDKALVSCAVFRDGQAMHHLRLSAGGTAGYDWRTQADATWRNRPAMQMLASPMPSIPATTLKRAPAPERAEEVRAAAPAPAPAPVASHEAAQAMTDEAVYDATPAPASAAEARLPYLGELDIDAVDRTVAAAQGREVGDFICALFSNGALLIEMHGQRLTLPLRYTRRLFAYLDGLRGDEIVEQAVGECG